MRFLNNRKRQESYRILLEDWNGRIKVKISELNEIKEKSAFIVNVDFRPELGEKYEGKFVSASASASTLLSNDDINPSDLLVISQIRLAPQLFFKWLHNCVYIKNIELRLRVASCD